MKCRLRFQHQSQSFFVGVGILSILLIATEFILVNDFHTHSFHRFREKYILLFFVIKKKTKFNDRLSDNGTT